MKHISRYISILLFILVCFLYNNTVFAADKYDSFNMVFSVYGDYSWNGSGKDYRLEEVNELFSSDRFGAAKYYSARVEYRKSVYSEEEIIDVIKEREGFCEASRDEVMYSEEIPAARLDPYMQKQWYLDNIDAYDAWGLADGAPGKDIVVAVVDSGVNYKHADLSDNMWINISEVYGAEGVDDDGNGVTDDIYGACFDAGNQGVDTITGDPYDTDKDGHGTHVAGIIAMSGGNGGGRGIAYSSKIMAVKAGGSDGKFLVSDVISAVNYAVKMGADVINMSFGATNKSEVLEELLKEASEKSVLVAAAGNERKSTDTYKMYPAAYPFVIGVMASDINDTIAEWSNYDTRNNNVITYDIAAPGVEIYSTVFNNKYKYLSGTSMAAPVVSAAAAVVFSNALVKGIDNPAKYTFGQLVSSSGQTAEYKDSAGNNYTYRKLNLYDAVMAEPSINMNVCGYEYMLENTGQIFSDIAYSKDERVIIHCGYKIQNTWAKAKNVEVNISVDSPECKVIKGASLTGDIDACSSSDIACNDDKAMIIEFNGETDKVYNIPISYNVTGQTEGEVPETISQSYTDVITLSLNNNLTALSNISGLSVSNYTGSNIQKPVKVKNLRVQRKGKSGKYSKIKLKWKKAQGADKYIIYYSSKKKTGFKKLAVCKKNSYVYKVKKGRKYYYRVRAYAGTGYDKVYGKYSNTVRG